MYEHECESDEDCEVYFLKPVNEYNILDRIKEANKELFAHTVPVSVAHADEDDSENEAASTQPGRKVTFATNLENYAPESVESNADASAVKSSSLDDNTEIDELQHKLAKDFQFPTIEEEETSLETTIGNETDLAVETITAKESVAEAVSKSDESTEMPDLSSTKESTEDPPIGVTTEVDVVEEICEEIVVMDMEGSEETEQNMVTSSTANTTTTATNHARNQRRMIKQSTATFDYDDDNRSLTNLLTSDGEEEVRSININRSSDDDDIGIDDDDEDDLSLIVASYLPNDFDNASLSSEQKSAALSPLSPTQRKSRRILPFGKRFSLRRKTSGNSRNSSNSIGTSTRHKPPPEVTDLKLNYKTCCEYRRHLEQPEKLPRYTGYMSEYGLSREALLKREENLQKKQHYSLEKTLKTSEQQLRKMHDNERAFTTWLKNKMRFPINKTRNMFDVRIRFAGGSGSCSGNSASRNRNPSSSSIGRKK